MYLPAIFPSGKIFPFSQRKSRLVKSLEFACIPFLEEWNDVGNIVWYIHFHEICCKDAEKYLGFKMLVFSSYSDSLMILGLFKVSDYNIT